MKNSHCGSEDGDIKLLLADRQKILRAGLKCLLSNSRYRVVGEAGDGREAIEMAEAIKPDIAIIEVALPELNGIDVTRKIKKLDEQVRVLILSAEENSTVIMETLRAGAVAFLVKEIDEEELERALNTVCKGQTYLSSEITSIVVQHQLGLNMNEDCEYKSRVFSDPSPREREVLQLIGDGLTSKQIGTRLKVSSKTVDTHRQNLMEKLEAESLADLVKHSIQAGLTSAIPTNNNS